MSNAETRKRLTEVLQVLHRGIQELQKSFPKEEGCGAPGCFEDATWVRATQFSGTHFFCEEHAKFQEDFGKGDPSYFYWSSLSDYENAQRKVAAQMKAYMPD